MHRVRKAGFTLIEMLVVIAIIAVLAAILFPVFSRARESSRRTVCLANLKQIGAAVLAYESDYAGFLPAWCISNPFSVPAVGQQAADPSVITWDVSIGSYLRSAEVLKCKSNPYGRDARAYCVAQYTQKVFVVGTSQRILGCYKDEIPNPVKTVYLFEKGANVPGAWGDALGQNVFQSHNDDYKTVTADGSMFHFDGKSFLYVDGHAKWAAKAQGPFAWDDGRPASLPGDIWPSDFSKWSGPGICAAAGRSDKGQGDWPPPEG